MIKYNNKHWFKFLFSRNGYFHEEMLISVFVYALLVVVLNWIYLEFQLQIFDFPGTFYTVLGLVVGLLLVFRTNTAYDRWWEGRKQLGALVNTCRSFSIKSKHYLNDSDVILLIKAFPYVLKEHLREEEWQYVPTDIREKLPSSFKSSIHKPNLLLDLLTQHLIKAFNKKDISGEQLIVLEKEVSSLANILGACERIKNTPIPFGYSIHLKRILLIYLIALPFGFIKSMEWYSIPFMIMVFYTMIGLELIAEEIEEPFGNDLNDLPFDELADKIATNINEISDREIEN